MSLTVSAGLDAYEWMFERDGRLLRALKQKLTPRRVMSITEKLKSPEAEIEKILPGADAREAKPGERAYKCALACAKTLCMPMPRVFVARSEHREACTLCYRISGGIECAALITDAALDALTPNQARFLMGHLLGHILCGHQPYLSICERDLPIAGLSPSVCAGENALVVTAERVPDAPLYDAVLIYDWLCAADVSADRAGVLCAGGHRPIWGMLAAMAGEKRITRRPREFDRAADAIERARVARDMPIEQRRLLAAEAFAGTDVFLRRVGHDSALRGVPIRNVDDCCDEMLLVGGGRSEPAREASGECEAPPVYELCGAARGGYPDFVTGELIAARRALDERLSALEIDPGARAMSAERATGGDSVAEALVGECARALKLDDKAQKCAVLRARRALDALASARPNEAKRDNDALKLFIAGREAGIACVDGEEHIALEMCGLSEYAEYGGAHAEKLALRLEAAPERERTELESLAREYAKLREIVADRAGAICVKRRSAAISALDSALYGARGRSDASAERAARRLITRGTPPRNEREKRVMELFIYTGTREYGACVKNTEE